MRYWTTALIATLGGATLAAATPVFAASSDAGIAVETAAATLAPNRFVWNDTAAGAPVRIVVNIGEQRAYVYRGEQLVAATTVSTGKNGKDTPSGTFTILQKETMHHSNLYNAAPMPFMQRLTWDGVAIHAGQNPGFPASHGCIRMPAEFARKLFTVTTVGTPVTVVGADGLVAPMPEVPGDTADETATANTTAAAEPAEVAAR